MDDRRMWAIKPGMLPDFPDSKVSGPLYQPGGLEGGEEQDKESVLPNYAIPRTEIQDEALRMELRKDNHAEEAPRWLEVEDVVMPEAMSEEEYRWKVPDWLERNVQPQDLIPIQDRQEEPMIRANHGASDHEARDRLWEQSDRDGRP